MENEEKQSACLGGKNFDFWKEGSVNCGYVSPSIHHNVEFFRAVCCVFSADSWWKTAEAQREVSLFLPVSTKKKPKKTHTFPLTRSFFILFQHNTPAHWLQRWRSSAHILALCPLLLRRFCVDGGHVQGWATQRYARRQDWHTCYFLKDPVAPATRNTALR